MKKESASLTARILVTGNTLRTPPRGVKTTADEVRNLADKSAEASNGTAALITGSIQAVEKGSRLAANTAKAMGEVGESAQRVAVMIDAIAKAAQEQSNGLAQINVGVDQISGVVQTNSATAQELSGQAQMLKNLVEQFQLRTASGSCLDTIKAECVDHEKILQNDKGDSWNEKLENW